MIRRTSLLFLFAAMLLTSGCPTTPKAPETRTQPGFGTAPAPSTAQLAEIATTVRNTKIFVDVLAFGTPRNGVPVVNVAHGTEAGKAALAALQEAFKSRGFRASSTELTSMGLGGPPLDVLLTQGNEAPVPSKLPVLLSSNLSGTQRGDWIRILFASVHVYARGGQAPATLAATYLSPNANRIEVFAMLAGGNGPRAHIWAVVFDSRSGLVLWSGTESENAAVLDIAVATSLVRSLVQKLPQLPANGTN